MKCQVAIHQITSLPEDIEYLIALSEKEGYRFVRRLVDDWLSGTNRFDKPGELLVGAVHKHSLIGLCGINQDPYVEAADIGRLRHLYVAADFRKTGVGGLLVKRCLGKSSKKFSKVRLRTSNDSASAFYKKIGFTEILDKTATHELIL